MFVTILLSFSFLSATEFSSNQPAAQANDGVCSSSLTVNGTKVVPSHGKVFYIDSGQGQNVDAAYVGYRVTNSSGSSRSDLWVKVSGFETDEVVQLVDARQDTYQLGTVANGATATAFFLLKALRSATTAQTHTVAVYTSNPAGTGLTPLITCTFSFEKVRETIKAAANKVKDITSTTTTKIGSDITVLVKGLTGTIGAGSSPDLSVLWFSPVARSSWPVAALRLKQTNITFFDKASNATDPCKAQDKITFSFSEADGSVKNRLVMRQADMDSGNGDLGKYNTIKCYEASYVFTIVGQAPSAPAVSPIAQISSGTQIKHTDMSGVDSIGLTVSSVTSASLNLALVKTATAGVTASDPSKSEFTYSLQLRNSESSIVSVEKIIDIADARMTYVSGSITGTGATAPLQGSTNTGVTPNTTDWIFQGPFSVPAASGANPGTLTITYKMVTPSCSTDGSTSFANQAFAYVGQTRFGSSATQVSSVSSTQSCSGGTSTPTYTNNTVSLDPTAEATNVTSLTTTSATLNGLVDPNGNNNQAIVCEVSTSSSFSSKQTITASPSSTGSSASSGNISVSCGATGLSAGTVYYYRIKVGTTVYSNTIQFQTNPAVGTAPTAVTNGAINIEANTTPPRATLVGTINPSLLTTTAKFEIVANANDSCPASPSGTSTYTVREQDESGAFVNTTLSGAYDTQVTMDLGRAGTTGDAYDDLVTFSLTSGNWYCYRVIANYSGGDVAGSWVPFRVQTPSLPTAVTDAASSIGAFTATLNGTMNSGSQSTVVTFCWRAAAGAETAQSGPSSPLSSCTDVTAAESPTEGTSPVPVSAAISSLTPGTLYFFEVKGVNASGTDLGGVQSFTTTALTPPTPTTNNASNINSTDAVLNSTVVAGSYNVTNVTYCVSTANNNPSSGQALTGCGVGTQGPVSNTTITAAQTASQVGSVTGLTANTTYYYQVIAVANNTSYYGGVVSFTTATSAVSPTVATDAASSVTNTSAQMNGTVTAGNASSDVEICWRAAAAGESIANPPTGTLANCATVVPGQSPVTGNSPTGVTYSLSALTGSTVYFYQVLATNTAGSGAGSIVGFTTLASPPTAATSTASSITHESATINGSAVGNGTANVHFCWGTDSQLTGCPNKTAATPNQVTGTSSTSASLGLTSLTAQTTYYFRIMANNGTGGDVVGNIESFTTEAAPTGPTAATSVATSVASTTATINGSVNPNGRLTTVEFCWGTATDLTGCATVSAAQSQLAPGNSLVSVSVALTGLNPGTTYFYRVIANNGIGGNVQGTIESFRALNSPTAVTANASSVQTTSATINGTINPGGAQTTVTFCYGTNSQLANCTSTAASQSPVSASFNNTSVSLNLTGLTGGTTYYFRVSATNSVSGPVNGNILSFSTSAVQQQGGGGGGGGGGSSTPSPTPTQTATPTPTQTATPTPTQTQSPRPTPRPTQTPTNRPTQRPTASPSPTSTAAASPSTSPSPTQTSNPAPSPTRTTPVPNSTSVAAPPAENREVGQGLNNWLTKDVPNNRPTPAPSPTQSAQPTQSPGESQSPEPSESPSVPADNGNGRAPIIKYDTGAELKLTENGSIDLKSVKSVTPTELASERITGFTPGTSLNIEVLGSRTGARFVASTAALVDELVLIEAIRNSIPAQAADFFQLSTVRVGSEPEKPEPWSEEEKVVAYDYFQASGLPLPVSLADLNLSDYDKWIELTSNAAGYVPGTKVFLTLTSTPLVISEGIVNKDGRIQLTGSLPVEFLNAGEHRVRLVGIRSIGGVGVDENGEITLSEETMQEIERFDLGTQATVRMGGTTPEGDYLNAIRVVPLIPVAPWWTLWFILVGFLIAAFARRKNWSNTKVKYWLTVSLNLAAAIPAVVIGWLSTVTLVTWVGLGLGLLAAGLTILVRPKRERERTNA